MADSPEFYRPIDFANLVRTKTDHYQEPALRMYSSQRGTTSLLQLRAKPKSQTSRYVFLMQASLSVDDLKALREAIDRQLAHHGSR